MAKKLTGRLEARAREDTPRGHPYRIGDTWLVKGEWFDITHAEAEQLEALEWPVTVREKAAAPEKETPADNG